MADSLLFNFGEIRPKTMYYIVQGFWPNFIATLKIRKKFKCGRNHLKFSMQHKNMYMYMHQEKL